MKKAKELPYYDHFIATESWVKKSLRKGLVKKSREFYVVDAVDKLGDGQYLIRLAKEFKI